MFIHHLVLSYLLGFIFTILFECPLFAIQKMILTSRRKITTKKETNGANIEQTEKLNNNLNLDGNENLSGEQYELYKVKHTNER